MPLFSDLINAPSVPSSILVQGSSSFEQIVGFRSKLATFSSSLYKDMIRFINHFAFQSQSQLVWRRDEHLDPLDYNHTRTGYYHTNEPLVEEKVIAMSNSISEQTDAIINSMLNIGQSFFNSQTTLIDINKVVDSIATVLDKEVGDDPNSIYSLRDLVRIYVTTSITAASFEILSTDNDMILIDQSVNAFRDAAKLRFDEEAIQLDRRNVNELISKGALHSTVGAELLSRYAIKKGNRAWEIIDKEAITLKLQTITSLWNTKVERVKTETAAYSLLPVELPGGIGNALGAIIDRSLLDPRSFIGAFPQILGTGMDALLDIRKLHQADRGQIVDKHAQYQGINNKLLELVLESSMRVAEAVGKMATFEAS